MTTAKEVAIEIMRIIQPKIDAMQVKIDSMRKEITAFEGRMQTMNSVLMNLRKHKKE